MDQLLLPIQWIREEATETETTPSWTGSRVRESSREKMRFQNPNIDKQSLSNLTLTTERRLPSLFIMNQIRWNIALEKKEYDPVTLNGFCWETRCVDTEDSDGLTKKKTLRNRESSGTKAHFTGTLPVYLLKNEKWTNTGTHREVREKLAGWMTEKMTGTHSNKI